MKENPADKIARTPKPDLFLEMSEGTLNVRFKAGAGSINTAWVTTTKGLHMVKIPTMEDVIRDKAVAAFSRETDYFVQAIQDQGALVAAPQDDKTKSNLITPPGSQHPRLRQLDLLGSDCNGSVSSDPCRHAARVDASTHCGSALESAMGPSPRVLRPRQSHGAVSSSPLGEDGVRDVARRLDSSPSHGLQVITDNSRTARSTSAQQGLRMER